MITKRAFLAGGAASLSALSVSGMFSHSHAADEIWQNLHDALFDKRAIETASYGLSLFAPQQAADAALVPVSIRLPGELAAKAQRLTLIIDRNPSPVAATIEFGDSYRNTPNVGERELATRIRVDSFSPVRAVLETTDGKLLMAEKFVMGAGGCSAPASKDPDEAIASLGRVRLVAKPSEAHDPKWRNVRIMIKHPNFTGLQMDASKGAFTPAMFVDSIELRHADQLVFRVEGGISLSEDPNIRMTMGVDGGSPFELRASDTDGRAFTASTGPSAS